MIQSKCVVHKDNRNHDSLLAGCNLPNVQQVVCSNLSFQISDMISLASSFTRSRRSTEACPQLWQFRRRGDGLPAMSFAFVIYRQSLAFGSMKIAWKWSWRRPCGRDNALPHLHTCLLTNMISRSCAFELNVKGTRTWVRTAASWQLTLSLWDYFNNSSEAIPEEIYLFDPCNVLHHAWTYMCLSAKRKCREFPIWDHAW